MYRSSLLLGECLYVQIMEVKMNKLKCKIVSAKDSWYKYLVIDNDYKIVANGISSDESWVIHDAGGFHTRNDFNKLYGENNWEVDFSDMYSDESHKITGKMEPNIIITFESSDRRFIWI